MVKNSCKRIIAVFKAEKTNILRNPRSLLTFIIMPVTLLILTFIENSASNCLILALGTIMPPIMATAAVIGENKEGGVLNGLLFAGLRWYEYLIGVAMAVGVFALLSVALMGMILEYSLGISMNQLLIGCSLCSVLCSMIIGAIIGVVSPNQSSISAIAVPVSLVLLFASIIGLNYEKIHHITQFVYSQVLIDMLMRGTSQNKEVVVFVCNLVIVSVVFGYFYGKKQKKN